MSTPDVALALRESQASTAAWAIRRRYTEDRDRIPRPLDEAEVSRRLLNLRDRLLSHMASHLPALTREDFEELGAIALAGLIQTPANKGEAYAPR